MPRAIVADVPPERRSVAPYQVQIEDTAALGRPTFFLTHGAAMRFAAGKASQDGIEDRTAHRFPEDLT